MDLLGSLALGISWNPPSPRRFPVCLWILQRHADLNDPWFFHYGFVQASKLVRLLSHGDYDAADLPSKKQLSCILNFICIFPSGILLEFFILELQSYSLYQIPVFKFYLLCCKTVFCGIHCFLIINFFYSDLVSHFANSCTNPDYCLLLSQQLS